MASRMNPSLVQTRPGFSGISLPLILNKENKFLIGFIWYVMATSLYLIANRFHYFEPQMLPMSAIDTATPFWPQTVWVYTSEYIFFIFCYLSCKDVVNTNRYIYSFLFLQVVSVLIFTLWPTTFPRENFPLPENLDAATYYLFSSLRNTDTPANCCPSLHVSSVFLSSFLFLNEQRKKFPIFFIWGLLIAASTLTTKQHYLIDVVTGFLMSVLVYWIFYRVVSYYPLGQKPAGANR